MGLGILYGGSLIFLAIKNKEAFLEEKGRFPVLIASEVLIYIAASIGISDFLLNTLMIKGGRLADDKKLPGTLVTCGVLPGAVIALPKS